MAEKELEELGAQYRTGVALAEIMNALPWVKPKSGKHFQARDFFPALPKREMSPDEMLEVMKANTVALGGSIPEA